MTDYLEEALDNAQALLDQMRRLEQGVPGVIRERGEWEPPSAPALALPEEPAPALTLAKEAGPALTPLGKAAPEAGPQAADRLSGEREEPESGRTSYAADMEETGLRRAERQLAEGEAGFARSGGELEVPRRAWTPLETEERAASPLLAQLERLERAAGRAAPASADGPGVRPAPWPEALPLSAPETAASEMPGAVQIGQGIGQALAEGSLRETEELRWAERADRAFRRDSRRYDGGFSLY